MSRAAFSPVSSSRQIRPWTRIAARAASQSPTCRSPATQPCQSCRLRLTGVGRVVGQERLQVRQAVLDDNQPGRLEHAAELIRPLLLRHRAGLPQSRSRDGPAEPIGLAEHEVRDGQGWSVAGPWRTGEWNSWATCQPRATAREIPWWAKGSTWLFTLDGVPPFIAISLIAAKLPPAGGRPGEDSESRRFL